jgi:hypothetical protein
VLDDAVDFLTYVYFEAQHQLPSLDVRIDSRGASFRARLLVDAPGVLDGRWDVAGGIVATAVVVTT